MLLLIFQFKAVFLPDFRVLHMIDLGEEHLKRTNEQPAVVVQRGIDHHFLPGLTVNGFADDHVEVFVRCGINRFPFEMTDDVSCLKRTLFHVHLTSRPENW